MSLPVDAAQFRLPPGWRKFTNLNGLVYYTTHNHRLITTDDISDPELLQQVEATYEENRPCFNDIDGDDARAEMLVYSGSVVHLASWDLGLTYNDDIDPEVDSTYWDYVWQYPMHRTSLPRFREEEFLNAFAFGANERVRNLKTTTFPFDGAQIRRIMQVYQDLKDGHIPHCNLLPALIYHIGRVMVFVASARQDDGYGTPTATQMYRPPPPAAPQEVQALDAFLTVTLCGTHQSYRTQLQAAVPGGVELPEFRRLMRTLLAEWGDSNLVATVILSVNVSFLGVPTITALPRTACLLSALCALGSLITGLHHVWQHREKTKTGYEDTVEYLYFLNLRSPEEQRKLPPTPLELTLTASLLALPLATLQWAVVSLMVGIAAFLSGVV
ncbi:hypothetical protein C8R46DRAFT_1309243 [Mycena filopes]|nr:hypothetical protein C8R46DRAFT_1309243 [Mycena filopes]